MKTLRFLSPALALLLAGCYATTPRPSDPNLLNATLPAKPHNGPVEVFFPGEKLPEKPYTKVALLETYNQTPANRINTLKKQARQYGSDGIIILTSTSRPVLENDETNFEAFTEILTGEEYPDQWTTRNQPFIQALAIVYDENLKPESFNQFAEVTVYDAESETYSSEGIKSVELNYDGDIIRDFTNEKNASTSEAMLYPERTTINFLLNDQERWMETRNYSGHTYQVVNRKQVDASGKWIRIVKFHYNNEDNIYKVELKERNLYPGQKPISFQLHVLYNEDNQIRQVLTQKLTRNQVELYALDSYEYEGNRLVRKIIGKKRDGKMSPWLRIDYQPFPKDYVLTEEQNQ